MMGLLLLFLLQLTPLPQPYDVGIIGDMIPLPPVTYLICPMPIVSTNPIVTYAPLSVTGPGSSDRRPAVCDPASGSTFPVGTTTVTCTAVDFAHLDDIRRCSFTVTIGGAP